MNAVEFGKWVEENHQGYNQPHYANGLSWRVVEMKDGWFAVFGFNPLSGDYNPAIQAKDLGHAIHYIVMHEAITVPFTII